MVDEQLRWNGLRTPATLEESTDKQRVERDILLLYHQLSKYSGVMGDLDWGATFRLPYWQFFDPKGLPPEDHEFMQTGCLMMVLTMAWETIDGAGSYISQFIPRIEFCLERVQPETGRVFRLRDAVMLAVQVAKNDQSRRSDKLVAETQWAFDEFVAGYYRRTLDRMTHKSPGTEPSN